MLVEAVIGDAYGTRFEFVEADYTVRNNNLTYRYSPCSLIEHPEDINPSIIAPGHYTDDTQMTLAVAEAMLDENESWTVESMADRFLSAFKRDERRGYTSYFLNVLQSSQTGKEMLSKIGGNSVKSGAFMRSAPLGLYDLKTLFERTELQTSITHNSWIGKNSAIGAALMVHYFFHKLGPKNKLIEWMKDIRLKDTLMNPEPINIEKEQIICWSPQIKRRVRCHGWDCLHAALYAVLESNSLSEVLQRTASYGGDTDTVAIIAMATASLCPEIERNIPQQLFDELENGIYGRDYIHKLDQELIRKFSEK